MPTLVLTRRYSADSNLLWRAALSAGWDVERLQSYEVPEGLAARDPVFYGETIWGDAVREPLRLALLQPTEDWLPRLPLRWRHRQVSLTSLGVARERTAPSFIKAPDEKWFAARVYPVSEDPAPDLPADLPVLMADPVRFAVEFRAFVCDRAVVALSPYLRGGSMAQDEGGRWICDPAELAAAREFAAGVVADPAVALPPAVVVDVGLLADGRWAVVEANAAWAAGLCDADPAQVLAVLRRASVPLADLASQDEPWVRSSRPS